MTLTNLRIQLDPGAYQPAQAHPTDAGFDLRAPADGIIPAHGTVFISTGVHIEIPAGWVGMICSRSGLAANSGISIPNDPGIIDPGYTGAIGVLLENKTQLDYYITQGDRIAQLLIIPTATPALTIVDHLTPTERGQRGFGSTGKA